MGPAGARCGALYSVRRHEGQRLDRQLFVGVHVKYRETTPIIFSSLLGLVMAFIAYGRMVLKPIA